MSHWSINNERLLLAPNLLSLALCKLDPPRAISSKMTLSSTIIITLTYIRVVLPSMLSSINITLSRYDRTVLRMSFPRPITVGVCLLL
jgi:hypothetical protein